jgi:hypothetical protein
MSRGRVPHAGGEVSCAPSVLRLFCRPPPHPSWKERTPLGQQPSALKLCRHLITMADADEDVIPRTGPSADDIDLSDETQDFRFLAALS